MGVEIAHYPRLKEFSLRTAQRFAFLISGQQWPDGPGCLDGHSHVALRTGQGTIGNRNGS